MLKNTSSIESAQIFKANGRIAIVHIKRGGHYYGLLEDLNTRAFQGGGYDTTCGWSFRKARRKALRHLFRLRKLN